MNLVVFGANGPTGRQVAAQALAAGHHVTAVTRRPDDYPLRSSRLSVVRADVTDQAGVDDAVAGGHAVISTFGVPYSRKKITVFSHGITAIVQAMRTHHVQRLVCVTSTTLAPHGAPGDPWFYRAVVHRVLRHVVGRTAYDDMARMEQIVETSPLDWTIVRPGGLFDAAEPTTDYEVAPRRLAGQCTSRADLAQTLIAEATAPRHPASVVDVITRSGTPHWTTFAKEALGISARTR